MSRSDYSRKFEAAVAEMNNAGVWRLNGMPPYLLVARRLGFEPRPPYYASFAKITLSFGVYFAVVWGLAMSLVFWRDYMPVPLQLISSAVAGLLFGIIMATWYRHVRRKRSLSSWGDL